MLRLALLAIFGLTLSTGCNDAPRVIERGPGESPEDDLFPELPDDLIVTRAYESSPEQAALYITAVTAEFTARVGVDWTVERFFETEDANGIVLTEGDGASTFAEALAAVTALAPQGLVMYEATSFREELIPMVRLTWWQDGFQTLAFRSGAGVLEIEIETVSDAGEDEVSFYLSAPAGAFPDDLNFWSQAPGELNPEAAGGVMP
jgi:hypothetical protein